MKRTLTTCILLGILGISGAAAQEPDSALSAAEKLLAGCTIRIDSLSQEYDILKDSLDARARRISGIKDKAPLSPAEHARLQEMMRDLDQFTALAEVDSQLKKSNRQRHDILRQLIALSTRKLDMLLTKSENGNQDRQQLDRTRELVEKRYGWELQLVGYDHEQQAVPQQQVAADSTDTRRTLMLKGDLLMDWRDRLAKEDSIAAARITALNNELAVRTRVAEVSQDISLFNEHDERLNRTGNEAGRFNNVSETVDTKEMEREVLFRHTTDYLFQDNPLASPLPSTIPGIQARIKQIQQYRRLIAARADSLQNRADWFYDKAVDTGRR